MWVWRTECLRACACNRQPHSKPRTMRGGMPAQVLPDPLPRKQGAGAAAHLANDFQRCQDRKLVHLYHLALRHRLVKPRHQPLRAVLRARRAGAPRVCKWAARACRWGCAHGSTADVALHTSVAGKASSLQVQHSRNRQAAGPGPHLEARQGGPQEGGGESRVEGLPLLPPLLPLCDHHAALAQHRQQVCGAGSATAGWRGLWRQACAGVWPPGAERCTHGRPLRCGAAPHLHTAATWGSCEPRRPREWPRGRPHGRRAGCRAVQGAGGQAVWRAPQGAPGSARRHAGIPHPSPAATPQRGRTPSSSAAACPPRSAPGPAATSSAACAAAAAPRAAWAAAPPSAGAAARHPLPPRLCARLWLPHAALVPWAGRRRAPPRGQRRQAESARPSSQQRPPARLWRAASAAASVDARSAAAHPAETLGGTPRCAAAAGRQRRADLR